MIDLIILGSAAFFAGLVDAVVGGGGLIQVPALFSVYPTITPPLLLGSNKLASFCGTASAAQRFLRFLPIRWSMVLPAALAAFFCSFLGAYAVTQISAKILHQALPFILCIVAFYILYKKDFGSVHAPKLQGAQEKSLALCIGGMIGFYDGFFGPGVGSFLIFFFVRIFGQDFVNASASAKIVNAASNLSALILFSVKGFVWWRLGIGMALMNILGNQMGSTLVLKHGTGFVRKMFLLVVVVLILKTGHDAFFLNR